LSLMLCVLCVSARNFSVPRCARGAEHPEKKASSISCKAQGSLRMDLAKHRWRLLPTLEVLESRLTPNGVQYTAVAAGDPTSNDVILWTRALDPAQPQALNLIAEVSTDPTFQLIDGVFLGKTDPGRDYTMKVDATGLQSSTAYYYRFLTGDG